MKETDQRKAGGEKLDPERTTAVLLADIAEIQTRIAALPILDDRSAEQIIGYDEFGLPV